MGGGLMQLVAYGAQDIYLTGNPQITFFKVVYRRHTNFAMEAIEQTFSGVCNFGNKVSCTIARNGDLVHRMYLEVDISGEIVASVSAGGSDSKLERFGHKLIKTVEIDIGGQTIDKHYGEWLEIWSQLTHSFEQLQKLRDMINGDLADESGKTDKVYVPLQFWFNRNPGLALPLIALQYHEVKLILEFEKKANIKFVDASENNSSLNPSSIKTLEASSSDFTLDAVTLYCDYIFLDTDERRRFAQVSHEYLIEQLQFNESVSATRSSSSQAKMNIDLTFNHPCKELVWVAQGDNCTGTYIYSSGEKYTDNTTGALNNNYIELMASGKLQLNGHDRMQERQGSYFRIVQPYQHHTGGALHGNKLNLNVDTDSATTTGADYESGYIYCYSFALRPEEHQPSGTCNFSRIDNAVLNMNLTNSGGARGGGVGEATTSVRVYAVNYNVLRIMSGMGGLAYSN